MRVLKGHTGKLQAVVYSPDGSKIATAGDAGVTKLWDVATGRELATIRQPDADSAMRADEKRVSRHSRICEQQFVRPPPVSVVASVPDAAPLAQLSSLAFGRRLPRLPAPLDRPSGWSRRRN